MSQSHKDFNAFWDHFIQSHKKPATQWMHTAGVGIWCTGIVVGIAKKSPTALLISSGAFAAMAVLAHPMFEGNWPENGGHPLYGILANFRMAWHTINGTMGQELERTAVAEPS